MAANVIADRIYPQVPPGRPEKSRLPELDAVNVPTLVVQGANDPFGTPPEGPNREVTRIPGTHSLKSDATVAAAVLEWLEHVGLGVPPTRSQVSSQESIATIATSRQ